MVEPVASPDIFEREQWIRCGKTWSDDFPAFIKAARTTTRLIPDWLHTLCFPAPDTLLPDIISIFLPEAEPSFQPTSLRAHFSSAQYVGDLPTVTLEKQLDIGLNVIHHLWHHHLPMSETTKLRTAFNGSWPVGMQSIILPHIPGVHFLLWVENFFNELATFWANCQICIQVTDWLSQMEVTPDEPIPKLIAQCRKWLSIIPWNSIVPGFHRAMLTMHSLAHLLTYKWLDDEIINAGGEYILKNVIPTILTLTSSMSTGMQQTQALLMWTSTGMTSQYQPVLIVLHPHHHGPISHPLMPHNGIQG
jgi:hypothetical protein